LHLLGCCTSNLLLLFKKEAEKKKKKKGLRSFEGSGSRPLVVELAEGGECVEESRVGVGLAVEDPGYDGLDAGEHSLLLVGGSGGLLVGH
jgi:hypothetical protein